MTFLAVIVEQSCQIRVIGIIGASGCLGREGIRKSIVDIKAHKKKILKLGGFQN